MKNKPDKPNHIDKLDPKLDPKIVYHNLLWAADDGDLTDSQLIVKAVRFGLDNGYKPREIFAHFVVAWAKLLKMDPEEVRECYKQGKYDFLLKRIQLVYDNLDR